MNNFCYFTINDNSYCLQNSVNAEAAFKLSRCALFFPLETGFTNLSYFSKKSYSGNGLSFSLGAGYSVNRILSILCSGYFHRVRFEKMPINILNTSGVPVAHVSEKADPIFNAGTSVIHSTENVSINYFELALHAVVQIPVFTPLSESTQ